MDDEPRRLEDEAAHLRQERDSISRAGPIVTVVLGGLVTFYSGGVLMAEAMAPTLCGSDCRDRPNPAGPAVTLGIGVTATIGGIVWLVNVNQARHELDRRIKAVEEHGMLLPTYEPTTRTAGLTFSRRF